MIKPENNQPTDTKMLDWLERQNTKARYGGRCIFRWSTTGRGWRLHETSVFASGASSSRTVREAIQKAMREDHDD